MDFFLLKNCPPKGHCLKKWRKENHPMALFIAQMKCPDELIKMHKTRTCFDEPLWKKKRPKDWTHFVVFKDFFQNFTSNISSFFSIELIWLKHVSITAHFFKTKQLKVFITIQKNNGSPYNTNRGPYWIYLILNKHWLQYNFVYYCFLLPFPLEYS